MGNILSPVPTDPRVTKCMNKFHIPENKMKVLWNSFRHYDDMGDGRMLMSVFLKTFLRYPSSPITDALPLFFDLRLDSHIYFGEFVDVICSVCFFEQMDLLKFMFSILDPTKSGYIDKHHFKHMLVSSWQNQPYDTVNKALEYLESIEPYGQYSYEEFISLRTQFPFIFYPLYAFQMAMMRGSFGEYWWEQHKAKYYDDAENLKKREAFVLEKSNSRSTDYHFQLIALKERMGWRYYLMPWMIAAEKKKMAKIASIEADLDQQVKALPRNIRVSMI